MGKPAPSFMAKTYKGDVVNINMQPVGSLTQSGHIAVSTPASRPTAIFLTLHRLFHRCVDRQQCICMRPRFLQVLLWFYPQASAGGKNRSVECITISRKFEDLMEQYKAKAVRIVGVSGDDADGNRKLACDCGLSYPLICDAGLSISAEYGAAECEDAGADFATKRMTAVLVDRDGNTQQIWPEVDRGFPEDCLKLLALAPPKRPGVFELTKIK